MQQELGDSRQQQGSCSEQQLEAGAGGCMVQEQGRGCGTQVDGAKAEDETGEGASGDQAPGDQAPGDQPPGDPLGPLLGRLPRELTLNVFGRLQAWDAWLVSRAFSAAFNACNTRLAISNLASARSISLVASSPQLQELSIKCHKPQAGAPREPGAARLGVNGVLLAAAAHGRLRSLHLDSSCSSRLSGRALAALAPGLRALTGLQKLSLQHLQRDEAGSAVLGPVLQRLTRLQALDLSYSLLQGRGGPAGTAALSPALATLTGLTRLSLKGAGMGPQGAAALPEVLQALRRLRVLDLGHNNLKTEGMQALAPALAHLTALRTLDLASARMGAGGCAALLPALRALPSLRALNLANNIVMGAEDVAAVFPALSGLTSLRLHRNVLKAPGAAALAPRLRELTALQELDLGHCSLGDEGAAVLAPALGALTRLRVLRLGDNDLEAAGLAALAPALQALTGLGVLSLARNYLGSGRHGDGRAVLAAALEAALGSLTRLQALSLRGNVLGCSQQFVAASLTACTGLTSLDLSYNLLSLEDLWGGPNPHLARALRALPLLRVLNLSHTCSAPGPVTFEAIAGLTGLRDLDVSGNNLGRDGAAAAFARVLRALTGLRTLQLEDNELGEAGFVALAPALHCLLSLAHPHPIRVVYCHGNGLNDEEARAMAKALMPVLAAPEPLLALVASDLPALRLPTQAGKSRNSSLVHKLGARLASWFERLRRR